MRNHPVLIALIAAVALTVAACSDDDGASVRESGTSTGSGSASGTGHATGSGTASGTGIGGECEPVGDLSAAQTRVEVTLDEWVIEPEADSAPAGAVGFVASNEGEEPHELVVVKGVAPTDLPLKRNGALDESKLPEGALVGEIEAFPGGTSCNGVFDLAPGQYTLACNVVEKAEGHVHLKKGMVTPFTVT